MKRKAWLILLIPVLLILQGVLLRPARLLKQAGIPFSAVRGVIALEYWYDWLQYTDGYDWVILRVNPETFTPPQDWSTMPASLADIKPQDSDRYHFFHWDFRDHPALPETFTAWFYRPVDPLTAFEDQEWFAAMYDERTGMLALYRGHSLYGMIPGYP